MPYLGHRGVLQSIHWFDDGFTVWHLESVPRGLPGRFLRL